MTMAACSTVLSTLFIFVLNLQVKRSSFVDSDFIGLTLLGNENDEVIHGETFTCSSLFQVRGGKFCFRIRSSRQSFFNILILMCGDVQSCPGPGNCTRNIQELDSLIKTRGIKIFHQNARGLSGNYGHVAELLQSFPGLHILSLSETHIEARSSQEEGVFDIPGYSFISRPRKSGKGGGVGAYILDGISWDRRDDMENENVEAIWLEIRPSHSISFLLCIMYRPPESSKYLSKDFNVHLHEMLAKASEKSQETILLGDLNVNFLRQDNKDLKSILNICGYKQMIQKPTRIAEASETLIDVILTNKPSNVVKTEVIPTGIGDHDMVGCVRKINHLRFKPRQIICRYYRSYQPEAMNKDLEAVDWTHFYSCRHVNEAWSIMKSILSNIFDRHAPKIC